MKGLKNNFKRRVHSFPPSFPRNSMGSVDTDWTTGIEPHYRTICDYGSYYNQSISQRYLSADETRSSQRGIGNADRNNGQWSGRNAEIRPWTAERKVSRAYWGRNNSFQLIQPKKEMHLEMRSKCCWNRNKSSFFYRGDRDTIGKEIGDGRRWIIHQFAELGSSHTNKHWPTEWIHEKKPRIGEKR